MTKLRVLVESASQRESHQEEEGHRCTPIMEDGTQCEFVGTKNTLETQAAGARGSERTKAFGRTEPVSGVPGGL